jgi:hypothetical protein
MPFEFVDSTELAELREFQKTFGRSEANPNNPPPPKGWWVRGVVAVLMFPGVLIGGCWFLAWWHARQ